ncbi:MAG: hypothetical protein IJS08_05210 [Victivallales bacterium]|nr:hypothetical protein [Victivallales bacterium]
MDCKTWTKISLYGTFVEVVTVLWLFLMGDCHINTKILVLFFMFLVASLLAFGAGCMALSMAMREKISSKEKVIAGSGTAVTTVIWLVMIVVSIVCG